MIFFHKHAHCDCCRVDADITLHAASEKVQGFFSYYLLLLLFSNLTDTHTHTLNNPDCFLPLSLAFFFFFIIKSGKWLLIPLTNRHLAPTNILVQAA